MTDHAILQTRLDEAEDALHRLNTGQLEASIDYDGRKVTYSAVNILELRGHIYTLKRQLSQRSGRRAIGARF